MRPIDADKLKERIVVVYESVHNYKLVNLLHKWIDQQPTVDEWISVKDRLPEKEGRYLVLTSGIFGIKIAMFTMSLKRHFDYMFEDGEPDRPGFYDWDSEDDWIEDGVTHWMHLPALPKEEE